MPKKQIDTLLYGLLIFLLLGGGILLYKFYTLQKPAQEEFKETPILAQPKTVKPLKFKKNFDSKQIKPTSDKVTPLSSFKDLPTRKRLELQTRTVKRKFKKTAKIDFNWPGDMDFRQVDVDGMAVVYGFNYNQDVKLTAVAREGVTNMDQVRTYIREYPEDIPNLNGEKIKQLNKSFKLDEASRKPGIKSVEVMQGTLKNGNSVSFALVNRTDKKGSYIFIYTAPQALMDNNDGYFERVFHSIKVLDAKNNK